MPRIASLVRALVVVAVMAGLVGQLASPVAAQEEPPSNAAPTIVSSPATATVQDTPIVVDLLAFATDPDPGDVLTVASIGPAASGAAVNNGDGTATYTPAPGFAGEDRFTFAIADAAGATATGELLVQVAAASLVDGGIVAPEETLLPTDPPPTSNTPPIAGDLSVETTVGTAIRIHLDDLAYDPDGDPIAFTGVGEVVHGVATIEDTTIVFVPEAGFAGNAGFTYTVADALAAGSGTVTIEVIARTGLVVTVYGHDTGVTPLPDFCLDVYPGAGTGGAIASACDDDDNAADGRIDLTVDAGDYLLDVRTSWPGYAANLIVPATVVARVAAPLDVVLPAEAVMTITKLGADTGQTPLPGACFAIHRDGDGDGAFDPAYLGTGTGHHPGTDGSLGGSCDAFSGVLDGVTRIGGWAPGTYFVVEESAPFGYLLAEPLAVTVTAGEQKSVPFVDRPGGAIVTVYGAGNQSGPLPGSIVFDIYTDAGGGALGDHVTSGATGDRPGSFHAAIRPGNYVLVMAAWSTPDGYLPMANRPFAVVEGAVTRLDVVLDAPNGDLDVVVLGADTGTTPLPGACFDLYLDDGDAMFGKAGDEFRGGRCDDEDGSDGILRFAELPAGRLYYLIETRSPLGYLLDATPREVRVAPNTTTRYEVVDRPGGLVVAVLGADTDGAPLPGACFTVHLDNGKGGAGTFVALVCDDADGARDGTLSRAIAPGAYILGQQAAPDGYAPIAPRGFQIANGAATRLDITLTRATAELTVTRRGADAGSAALPGACFDLHRDNGDGVFAPATDVRAAGRCDAEDPKDLVGGNGQTHFTGIAPGTYFLVETRTPAGHGTALPILVEGLQGGEARQVAVLDPAPATLTVLSRVDPDYHIDSKGYGACFDLRRDANGNGAPDADEPTVASACDFSLPLGDDGITEFWFPVPPGSYLLVETTIPVTASYHELLRAEPHPVTLLPGEHANTTVLHPTRNAFLVLDLRNNRFPRRTLHDACVDLRRDSDGDGVVDGDADPVAFTECDFTFNDMGHDGELWIDEIPPGRYIVVETKAPYDPESGEQYLLADPLPLNLLAGHQSVRLEHRSTTGDLTVVKLAADQGTTPIPGACFALHQDADANGVPDAGVATVASACDGPKDLVGGGDGHTEFVAQRPGRYVVVETTAPGGYALASPVPVEFKAGTHTELDVTDAPLAPMVAALDAYQGLAEGSLESFDLGSFTNVATNGPWTVSVVWGDGATETFEVPQTGALGVRAHAYPDEGAYTATVEVRGRFGAAGASRMTVEVANVAPSLGPIVAPSVDEGSETQIAVLATDPGPGDVLTIAYDCDNDLNYESTTGRCRFHDDGFPQVNVRVDDGDGGVTLGSTAVYVYNARPTVTAPADQTADEGSHTALELGSFADPGRDDPWTMDVNWGDGTSDRTTLIAPGALGSLIHRYADDGDYTVELVVMDEDQAFSFPATFTVRVANVAPTATANFDAAAVGCGIGNASLTISAFDPGADDLTGSIAWGDGTPSEVFAPVAGGSRSFLHTYAKSGRYTATVSVSDGASGGVATASVSVSFDITRGGVLPPIDQDGSSRFSNKGNVPVKVQFLDCDGSTPSDLAPTLTVTILSGGVPVGTINEPIATGTGDTSGVLHYADGIYSYNLSARQLPDPTATYRITITVPRTGQTITATFGIK